MKEKNGVKKEEGFNRQTTIEELNLSTKVCLILRNAGIDTLGTLLACRKSDLEAVFRLGSSGCAEIENTLHSLGYVLSGEKKESLHEQIDITKQSISYLNLPHGIIWGSYSRGIFTVGDLVMCDEKLLKGIRNAGEVGVKRIRDAVHAHGCIFIDEDPSVLSSYWRKNDKKVKNNDEISLDIENQKIATLIDEKERLVTELEEVLQERERLTNYDMELSQKIEYLVSLATSRGWVKKR